MITSLQLLTTILVVIFPLGQLTRLFLPVPDIRIYWHDVIVLFILVGHWQRILPLIKKYSALMYFCIFTGVSLLTAMTWLPVTQVFLGSLYFARWLAYAGVFLIMQYSFKQQFRSQLTWLLNLAIGLTLLLSWLQYAFFSQLEPLYVSGWDRHAFRIVGTLLDPNFLGILLVLMLLWQFRQIKIVYTAHNQSFASVHLLLLILSCTSLVVTLLFTYSRNAYLAFAVAVASFMIQSRQWLLLCGITLLFGTGILFLPRYIGEGTNLLRVSSVQARAEAMRQDWHLIQQRSVFGYGFNTIASTRQHMGLLKPTRVQENHAASGSINSVFQLLLMVGVVGSVVYFQTIYSFISTIWKDPYVFSSLVTLGVGGMAINVWWYPWIILWFYLSLVTVKKPIE